ncbi:hypothetical protein OJ997_20225 [Solirubrobacter phytolaccae]|uniref:Uncharacterized protein n=1 Tax=Solirubrobacter phytolaccae TaxID=1404360 RepID=A0A9X3NCL8_9ACTN|nr:hypothetical protein [Solirubrobacter phytolaccae]MDA0182649.1 hypothetical protein [Solirubrobacter phytolaccae]
MSAARETGGTWRAAWPGGRSWSDGAAPWRVVLLWVAAALISGFTARRYLGPLDEGVLLQAASRIADGQWPWRDFGWAYGPGQPLAQLALGDSLLSWRIFRVAADATAAVLIWALVRNARPRWALPAWLAAAVTAAQPTSANPTAPALAFALGAVFLATRGRPAWAGALAALAAFWRPDVGAIAALAAAAVFVAERRDRERAAGRGAAVGDNAAAGRGVAAGGDVATTSGPRAAVVTLVSAALVGLALYAPFIVAAGPGTVWDALVVQATRDGEYWRLPFPDGFPGGDAKDFLQWLAPYGALIVLVVAAVQRRAVGLVVLGAGAAIYFLSRADLEHAQGLLVVAAGLAAVIRPRLLGAALLAILIAVGVGNRASALLRPPDLVAFDSVRIPPEEAEALTKTIALVHELVPPGEPIYVAPRRSDLVSFSNPLLHRLTDRPNVLRRDVLLQAKPDEQAAIVAKLRQTRPRVIIRWTDPASASREPNARGRPSGSRALDEYIDANYTLRARYGYYDVLASRSIASR